MKKLLLLFSLFFAAVSFQSCGESDDSDITIDDISKSYYNGEYSVAANSLIATVNGKAVTAKSAKVTFHTTNMTTATISLYNIIDGSSEKVFQNVKIIMGESNGGSAVLFYLTEGEKSIGKGMIAGRAFSDSYEMQLELNY